MITKEHHDWYMRQLKNDVPEGQHLIHADIVRYDGTRETLLPDITLKEPCICATNLEDAFEVVDHYAWEVESYVRESNRNLIRSKHPDNWLIPEYSGPLGAEYVEYSVNGDADRIEIYSEETYLECHRIYYDHLDTMPKIRAAMLALTEYAEQPVTTQCWQLYDQFRLRSMGDPGWNIHPRLFRVMVKGLEEWLSVLLPDN